MDSALVDIFELHRDDKNIISLAKKFHNNDNLSSLLINETSFLQSDSNTRSRIYCIYHEIKEQPICVICNKPTILSKYKRGFEKTCRSNICKNEVRKQF